VPCPDPDALELFEEDDRVIVGGLLDLWPSPSSAPYHKHRKARIRAIQRQLDHNGRACRWCGDMIPLERPADAEFAARDAGTELTGSAVRTKKQRRCRWLRQSKS
jgi:hypothetical protein